GYAALKINLALGLQAGSLRPTSDCGEPGDIGSIKRAVLERSVSSLADTAHLLDDDALDRTIDLLVRARRVEVYGVGGSAAIAQTAHALWIQIGLPVVVVTDSHLQVMSAVQLQPGDVAVAFTTSGSTRDTVEVLRAAREAGAATVCLTSSGRSPITRVADVTLLAASHPTTIGGHLIHSRVSDFAVIDVIATAAALRRTGESLAALARGRQAISENKRY
ncbi:MAG TPA: MurR/RpiR family transcriptional regulator, partial [Chloroflexota bacterium]|nr:MurR/RpiR family transcriptional regulator [Chloroflexota bacterium]